MGLLVFKRLVMSYPSERITQVNLLNNVQPGGQSEAFLNSFLKKNMRNEVSVRWSVKDSHHTDSSLRKNIM